MRRMSNCGGHFAKKIEAEKKSASSCSSDDVIFMVTSGQSLLVEEGWEGTKGKYGGSEWTKAGDYFAVRCCLQAMPRATPTVIMDTRKC
ncbi:hypothetical protein Tco_0678126 [Tanacetum coccineum]|uniref:Uncharacterized protein n=1 Tax=Tanacetum coccineum TaxID=301880 RepID=A0ABQ4XER0_9ASTR